MSWRFAEALKVTADLHAHQNLNGTDAGARRRRVSTDPAYGRFDGLRWRRPF
jgi:hypothetical protein